MPQAPDREALNIARKVYGIDASRPAGFYVDVDPYPDRQTLTMHIRESEIRPIAAPIDFESCTDDFAEALGWSGTQAIQRGFDTSLAGTSESDWYFQFDREIQSASPAMLVNRVFKCGNLDRSVLSDGHVGLLNSQPAEAEDLRFVVEYLWGFSRYNNAFHAVVSSRRNSDVPLGHTIVRAEAIRAAGSDECDLIETWAHDYTLSTTTGLVTETIRFEDVFRARLSAGSAEICSD